MLANMHRPLEKLKERVPAVQTDGHIPRVRSILNKSHHRVPPQKDK